MAILKPQLNVTPFHYDQTPKARLAELVNEQGRQIVALTKQKHDLMALLVALVKHPDAFRVDAHGRAWLKTAAIHELKEHTTLRTEASADGTEIMIKVLQSDYVLRAESFSIGTAMGPLGPGYPANGT